MNSHQCLVASEGAALEYVYDEGSSVSPSTCDSPERGSIISPRPSRQPSFSSVPSESEPPTIQLHGTVEFTTPLIDYFQNFSSIEDRFKELSISSQRLFKTCGTNPAIQHAAMNIFESAAFHSKKAIPLELAVPLLEKVKYSTTVNGRGKRGAPEFYRCLWGSCGEKMTRRLHALEHIMTHVDNRSHVCTDWCVTLLSNAIAYLKPIIAARALFARTN